MYGQAGRVSEGGKEEEVERMGHSMLKSEGSEQGGKDGREICLVIIRP